jgi:hypothetical protein
MLIYNNNEKISINENTEVEVKEANVINVYQELNNKCDVVISKIKNRKLKKSKAA